jgi:hypothetical protein
LLLDNLMGFKKSINVDVRSRLIPEVRMASRRLKFEMKNSRHWWTISTFEEVGILIRTYFDLLTFYLPLRGYGKVSAPAEKCRFCSRILILAVISIMSFLRDRLRQISIYFSTSVTVQHPHPFCKFVV